MQPVGRLDEDTTGLLLLTDDGALIHRLTSPKHHVPKVYDVTAKHPVDDAQLDALRAGVVLDDDPQPVRALAAERTGERTLALTLDEGRYHQVKRMLAAVGNRVEALHRSAFGGLDLAGVAPGAWRWVERRRAAAARRAASGPADDVVALAAGRDDVQPADEALLPAARQQRRRRLRRAAGAAPASCRGARSRRPTRAPGSRCGRPCRAPMHARTTPSMAPMASIQKSAGNTPSSMPPGISVPSSRNACASTLSSTPWSTASAVKRSRSCAWC